jgi:invasion protein IalB
MKQVLTLVAFGLLTGCAPTASTNEFIARAEATTLSSGWRVDCTEDDVLATRRCYAAIFGKTSYGQEAPFQVYYINKNGPYIMAGHHDDPSAEAVVRVDDKAPVFLTNINEFIIAKTSAEHRADAGKLVKSLKTGSTAAVRYTRFAEGSRDISVDLTGFNEAHSLLMQKVGSAS